MKDEVDDYTKFERARIIGARALQISANAPILLKISKEALETINYDPIKISEMEFEQKVLPITVRRPLPRRIEKEEEYVEVIEEVIGEETEKPKEKVEAEAEPAETTEVAEVKEKEVEEVKGKKEEKEEIEEPEEETVDEAIDELGKDSAETFEE